MTCREFEYFAPASVGQCTALLKTYGSRAKILAGGMSLIPVMKLRLGAPAYLIDINGISGLDYIRETRDSLRIGALTRHHALETSSLVRRKEPLLAETAAWIGDPQVRNRGTIGGALVHADPSGDWGATILAMRGEMKLRGPARERVIAADNFFVDTFTSAAKGNELLVEVRIPVPRRRSGGSYMKLERKSGDFATVGVATQISLDEEGVCDYAGIGLTAVGMTNIRAKGAEAALLGKVPTDSTIEDAAEAASEDASPMSDPLRGSVEYKKAMTKVFTRRGLQLAVKRAKGVA
ncbi:MAG: xanthine dehydrogenase family protein subunit M [Thaumarchaeota archaeon]|nr:xanthine dehydrogenase family protein subunit M [Nitrososphaerota archaeon]